MFSVNTKSLLKSIKTNENLLSALFGVVVIVLIGAVLVKYFSNKGGDVNIPAVTGENLEGNFKTHKVVKGDTLWTISEKYFGSGYNWVDIARENNLTNPGLIEVDQELSIPEITDQSNSAAGFTSEATTQTPTPTLTPTPQMDNEDTITEGTYVVVSGDNLWKICLRAYGDGYKWVEIAKTNSLKNPNLILPGMSLTLPR